MWHFGAAFTHARQQRHPGGGLGWDAGRQLPLAGRGHTAWRGRVACSPRWLSWLAGHPWPARTRCVSPRTCCSLLPTAGRALLPTAHPQLLQADTFDLHSFHTLTGTTFMLLAEPQTPDAAELLRTT